MGPEQVLQLRVRIDLGVMAIKKYPTFLKAIELEPHYQMKFRDILRISYLGESYSSTEGTISEFLALEI